MRNALFAHLKQLAGDTSDKPWGDDNLPGFFQRFRPDGKGVESALSLVPNASAHIARLLPVYRATSHARWANELYFVVREPPAAEESRIIAWGQEFLKNLQVLATVVGNDEFSSYLASVAQVQVLPPGQLNLNSDDHSLVYDTIGDFLGPSDRNHPIWILREAYYYIACDRDLVFYLQWPFFEHLCRVDCFEPYFRLWQHGFSYAFDGASLNLARR